MESHIFYFTRIEIQVKIDEKKVWVDIAKLYNFVRKEKKTDISSRFDFNQNARDTLGTM